MHTRCGSREEKGEGEKGRGEGKGEGFGRVWERVGEGEEVQENHKHEGLE